MRTHRQHTHIRSLLALGVLLLLGAAGMRAVQAADNASASATAVVLQPIAVSKNTDLVFGNVVAGNGDVTLATDGTRTKSGSTGLPTGVTPVAARFDVSGTGSNTFSISYAGSDTVLTDGSSNTMAVDWIVEVLAGTTPSGKTDATSDPTTGTLSSGAAHIFVGGKLTVGSSQVAGTYTGSVVVTVAYN